MRRTVVAKSWNRIALQIRFGANIRLKGVETMQLIRRTEMVKYIARVLINLHRAWRELNVMGSGRVVCDRNQRQQSIRRGLAQRDYRSALRRGENRTVLQKTLALS